MAQVAYYRMNQLTEASAEVLRDKMQKQADKVFGKAADEYKRLATHIVAGTTHTERIKVEVTCLADVLAVERVPGFVRFCHGGYKDIHELIAVQKKEGRNDWYA